MPSCTPHQKWDFGLGVGGGLVCRRWLVEFKVFGEKLVGVLRRVFWNFTNHGSSGGRAALYSEVCPRF